MESAAAAEASWKLGVRPPVAVVQSKMSRLQICF